MMWVLAAVVVVILALTAVVASGRWGSMPPLVDDRPRVLPGPDHDLTGDDLRATRFSVVPRGYSMEQVDAVLQRAAEAIDAHRAAAPAAPAEPLDEAAGGARRGLGEHPTPSA